MKKTLLALLIAVSPAAFAQAPPSDAPTFRVGATIFTDFTYQQSPEIQDQDKEAVHLSSFNVSRAYINFTGNLNRYLAFRITPDITRETGSSSLNGSLTFRLKYAYGQFNLDDWTTRGSWLRFGIHQTPYIDYTEGIYRYRFQGPIFVDREGIMSASDAGFSGHWNFPGNYGDVHAGIYNGENYNHPETNNQKSVQLRATLRPLPLGGAAKGLRLTGFVDQDKPSSHGARDRYIGQVSFEHPRVVAGVEFVRTKDRAFANAAEADARGWSGWVTPRFGTSGWEALLRHDELEPNKDIASQKRKRNIAGVAYWFHPLQGVQSALLVDYDSLQRTGLTRTTNYAVHMLINF